MNIPCIKTGDFARLCGTNRRTLIHYDEIGLFSPAYTDEKGYRYYSENQCDVFFTITCLKELGMPLRQIRDYISHQDPQTIRLLLQKQQKKVAAELEHLRRIQTVINTKLSLITQAENYSDVSHISEIFIEEQQEDEILILSAPIFSDDHDTIFSCLCAHIGTCSRHSLNCGHPYGAMLPSENISAGDYNTYAYFFTKISPSAVDIPGHIHTHVKRKGTYASVCLRGDYYQADPAFEKLIAYPAEHNMHPGQYIYKEAVLDELTARKEEYLTKISVQCLQGSC